MSPALLTEVRHPSLLLAITLGVGLIGLGGVNLVFLTVSPKLITVLPMLPDPIPYFKLKSLLLQQRFFHLASCFLIAFSSLSDFQPNCAIDWFVGLGLFLPFFAAQESDFFVSTFLYLQLFVVLYVVHVHPCFLQRLQCFFLVQAFLGTLAVDLVPGTSCFLSCLCWKLSWWIVCWIFLGYLRAQ